jgi:hypothetical protein
MDQRFCANSVRLNSRPLGFRFNFAGSTRETLRRNRVLHFWDDTIVGDPPARLSDYLEAEFPDRDRTFGKRPGWAFRYLDSGIDPWGSPFIFESELTRGAEGSGLLVLTKPELSHALSLVFTASLATDVCMRWYAMHVTGPFI